MRCVLLAITMMFVGLTFVCSRKVVDLTHVLDKDTPKYPLRDLGDNITFTHYEYNTLLAKYYENGMWLVYSTVNIFRRILSLLIYNIILKKVIKYLKGIKPTYS